MSAELISAIVWVLVAIAAVLLVALEVAHASNVPARKSPRRVVTDEGSVRGTARQTYPRTPRNTTTKGGVRHAR